MLIVAGTVRIATGQMDLLRPYMQAMITHSRAEEGCLAYSYAEDVMEPGLIRVFEAWRNRAALDAHFASPHLAAWRAVWGKFGVSDRRLIAYEVASHSPV